jgi:hypothetical protein
MEACELVRLTLNKITVPSEPKRAGNPGYGVKVAIRVLVYARLKGLGNDTRISWHLKRHPQHAHTLGLHRNTGQNNHMPLVDTLQFNPKRSHGKNSKHHQRKHPNNTSNR